jgi:hypothetical protein
MKKTILYPIFIKCLSFISDPFWRYIYEDLAYGRCPYGLYLQKNYLCCGIKNKEFSYKIENEKDVQEIYNETYSLLKQRVGILSEKEKLIQREKVLKNRLVQYKKEDWTNVKKKMIRDTLLENFVLQKTNQYSLSINVSKKVLSLLIIGLLFKSINSKDIYYSNGYIQEIDGLYFQPKKVLITKNLYSNKNIKINDEEGQPIKYLYTYWQNFISEMSIIACK